MQFGRFRTFAKNVKCNKNRIFASILSFYTNFERRSSPWPLVSYNRPFEVSSWLCMRKTKTVTKIRKESAVASFLNAIQCKHRGDYRYQTIKENKICQCMTESIICFVFLSLHQLLLSLEQN